MTDRQDPRHCPGGRAALNLAARSNACLGKAAPQLGNYAVVDTSTDRRYLALAARTRQRLHPPHGTAATGHLTCSTVPYPPTTEEPLEHPARASGPGPARLPTSYRKHRSTAISPSSTIPSETGRLGKIATACPEMTALADLVRDFATLLKPAQGNDLKLTEWITAARAVDLPHMRSLTNGLEIDRPAVDAGLTLPYHNGRTEGVNTRTKRIMRQMHGRAGFDLLRHRILLP
ncbi:hypothetical protein SSP24_83590 [Streptomyces spinoverrucosus]|uniref:Transposase IS204/IS1001/IS1096/IS1165 DDE domain-containing protein n=1 Tax=Streptomyces spinoverrucosus TaxID=284043 RepID=A0A4Y3VUR0_9ACTN|nr:hypothetical protein SSP24_83590 [Streptomyces spinoverrucosus]GHB99733.1 hypothetical protein GCM10010397_84810 [Streptomyces spinoverrucosus]